MEPGKYLNKKIRLLIAFIGALFSVLYGRLDEFLLAFATLLFYIALFFSFFIALLIISLTHYAWEWFAKGGVPGPGIIFKLLFIGYVTPVMVDFILMGLYYALRRQNIFSNGYIGNDFIVVNILVLALNAIYLLQYLFTAISKSDKNKEVASDAGISTESFTVKHRSNYVRLKQADIIVCYRMSRKSEIITNGKGTFTSSQALSQISDQLNRSFFRQINRSVVINLNTVKGYTKGAKRDVLEIVIKKDFQPFFTGFSPEQLSVTKEYKEAFKQAFEALQEES
jgi:hypothetical protein